MRRCTVTNEAELARFARALVRGIDWGDTIGLSGDLGAGKTTLVRYFVEALGGHPQHVSSPSFTLQNDYRIPPNRAVEHWDLYRTVTPPIEVLEPPSRATIRLIEWPERNAEVNRSVNVTIRIDVVDSGARAISWMGSHVERIERAIKEEHLRTV